MSGPRDARVTAPFMVVCDSREQDPYLFRSIRSNADKGYAPVEVPTMRMGLPVGDYMAFGFPRCIIERKTLVDLYASVVRRENFEGRLARMSELMSGPSAGYAAVVVEAERMECIRNPPKFSKFSPKALSRTLIAWDVRYPVKWHFMPGREAAEILTYRLLEAFHKTHREEVVAHP